MEYCLGSASDLLEGALPFTHTHTLSLSRFVNQDGESKVFHFISVTQSNWKRIADVF